MAARVQNISVKTGWLHKKYAEVLHFGGIISKSQVNHVITESCGTLTNYDINVSRLQFTSSDAPEVIS